MSAFIQTKFDQTIFKFLCLMLAYYFNSIIFLQVIIARNYTMFYQ